MTTTKKTPKDDTAHLTTFEACDAALEANIERDMSVPFNGGWGRPKNAALHRRIHARARAIAIETLGYAPEVLDQGPGERYAATTSEFIMWAKRRLNGLEDASGRPTDPGRVDPRASAPVAS